MDKQVISFNANEQQLTRIGGECHYSSNKVSYIEAHFDLGANWGGFDSVRAVWFTDFVKGISTVLDADGICIVPTEVLRYKGKVSVNLVGSISVADVLTDRLTSYPIAALIVDANARVESTETAEVTPSQFDQFVAIVRDEVEEVTGMTAEAETLPAGSDATASYSDGVLSFGIPRGEQGAKGDKGDTGDVGPQGPRGERGPQGIQGETGPQGEIGATGATGPQGPKGDKGDKGDTGANGFSPIVTVTEITGGHEVSIEDATQTQTFDVMDGDTPVIPWDSILPVDSASGAIASFPDGTDLVPAKALSVALEPIQDLHGYDKPWSGGSGVNKLPPIESGTVNGITLTNDNGQYTLNGTATANAFFTIVLDNPLASGSYYWALFNPTAQSGVTAYLLLSSGNVSMTTTTANAERVINPSAEITTFRIRVDSGTTLTNFKLSPMIAQGSTATSFEPYSNICPISGRTECVTHRTGKNLFPQAEVNLGKPNARTANVYLTLKAGTYMVSYTRGGTYTGTSFGIQAFKDTKRVGSVNATGVLEVSEEADHLYFYFPASAYNNNETVSFSDIQLELGATATDYEPYNGDTYTTDLGRTVYGGQLDVVSGELVVDRAMVDLGTLTWTRNTSGTEGVYYFSTPSNAIPAKVQSNAVPINGVCSQYAISAANVIAFGTVPNGRLGVSDGKSVRIRDDSYSIASDFKTAMDGVQLCYELATPQTYQLTPTEVSLLLGQNNVWSDGDVTVVYNADIQRYIEKKLS